MVENESVDSQKGIVMHIPKPVLGQADEAEHHIDSDGL